MGSYKQDRDDAAAQYKRFRRMLKTCWISCLGSFSISIVGGLMLTCWDLRYHHTNSQLWMVPIGLILFITPAIVWLSIFISDIFSSNSKEDDHDVDLQPAAAAAGIPHDSSATSNLDPER